MANHKRLPKISSQKSMMRAKLPTTEDEFNPRKANLDNPSPQTVLQMQQTFGNKATLFRLGKQLEAVGTTLQIRYGDLKPSSYKR